MKISISSSDEDTKQIADRIMAVLNTEFARDVVLHGTYTTRMPHALEKGYVSIYVNTTRPGGE